MIESSSDFCSFLFAHCWWWHGKRAVHRSVFIPRLFSERHTGRTYRLTLITAGITAGMAWWRDGRDSTSHHGGYGLMWLGLGPTVVRTLDAHIPVSMHIFLFLYSTTTHKKWWRREPAPPPSGFLTDAISFLSHAISHCMRYLMRYRMRYRTQKYRMRYRIAISQTISHAINKDIA